MKIASSQLQMASAHSSRQYRETSESLTMWVGNRQPGGQTQNGSANLASGNVSLSETGKQQAADSQSSEDSDPKLRLIRSLLEFLTGKSIRLLDSSQFPAQGNGTASTGGTASASAGFGLAYDHHSSYSESEQTSFSANGTIKTADGRTIDFNLQLSMSRSYYEESNVSIRLGDAARTTDPLILNFAGTAAQLSDQRFSFDLNADGTAEQINRPASGSGFLALDRNHDGAINDGSELFGPGSGNGFSELATLDGDQNGWIDENDAAYSQLRIWQPTADGAGQLQTLQAAGVGAISLTNTATPFDIKNNANELLGKIRSTGIFLHEDGSTGTIQQVDLTA